MSGIGGKPAIRCGRQVSECQVRDARARPGGLLHPAHRRHRSGSSGGPLTQQAARSSAREHDAHSPALLDVLHGASAVVGTVRCAHARRRRSARWMTAELDRGMHDAFSSRARRHHESRGRLTSFVSSSSGRGPRPPEASCSSRTPIGADIRMRFIGTPCPPCATSVLIRLGMAPPPPLAAQTAAARAWPRRRRRRSRKSKPVRRAVMTNSGHAAGSRGPSSMAPGASRTER